MPTHTPEQKNRILAHVYDTDTQPVNLLGISTLNETPLRGQVELKTPKYFRVLWGDGTRVRYYVEDLRAGRGAPTLAVPDSEEARYAYASAQVARHATKLHTAKVDVEAALYRSPEALEKALEALRERAAAYWRLRTALERKSNPLPNMTGVVPSRMPDVVDKLLGL